MKCPKCQSSQLRKNGHPQGRQRYLCKDCGKQFLEPVLSQVVTNEKLNEVIVTPTLENLTNNQESLLNSPEILLESSISETENTSEIPSADIIHITENNPILPGFNNIKISMLLLDAENLKIDNKTEQFLAGLSKFPLQVKIAFANWRNPSIGQQDVDFHKRGYNLIHVPGGKDSADAKMIAKGISLCWYYPNIQEIFICSSDSLLVNLCNELQNNGLTVYRVCRQGTTLSIENRNTGETYYYSLAVGAEIPDLEDLMLEIKSWLMTEQNLINDRLSNLTNLSILFQERYNINNTSRSLEYDSRLDYVSETNKTDEILLENSSISITSLESLELLIIQIITENSVNNGIDYVSVNHIRNYFLSQYKETVDAIVKKFEPNSSFIKFLRSRPEVFKLTLLNQEHQVAIAK